MRRAAAAASGLLFGLGLIVAGMTDPTKVRGFLDFAGDWDPTLAFVMAGAIGVHATAFRLITRRKRPLLAPQFRIPSRTDIDKRMLLGAALFGAGWGLAGICPGPAIVSLGLGERAFFVFVAAMVAGVWLHSSIGRATAADRSPAEGRPETTTSSPAHGL